MFLIGDELLSSKVFVEITAKHDVNGKIRPLTIKWEDGRIFEVDHVLDLRQAASLKGGGLGIRYTCRIRNKEAYLFNDEGKCMWKENKNCRGLLA
jgi:hypothetical protein